MLLLGRLLPTGQLGFAAVASLFVAAAVIDAGTLWGLAVWVIASLIALLISPDSSAGWMFAAFFGYYPVVKLVCEGRLPVRVAWCVKVIVFYLGIAAAFAVLGFVTGYIEQYGSWIIPVAVVGGGVIFVIFDIGYSKLIDVYRARISKKR